MTCAAAHPGRARAIAAVLVALATAIAAAAVALGCDRVVNLTPFYDAPRGLDAHPDSVFDLEDAPVDGLPALDGSQPPPDGGGTSDGDAFPDDGNTAG